MTRPDSRPQLYMENEILRMNKTGQVEIMLY